MKQKTLLVFGSGNGSNFKAIADYFRGKSVKIICVSDKENAFILERAKRLDIEHYFVPFEETEEFLKSCHPEEQSDERTSKKNEILTGCTSPQNDEYIDLIALAGYMRILPPAIVKKYKIINIHPALLPNYKGLNAIERAFRAGEKITGVTVHYVNDEVDNGKIIEQISVSIDNGMTLNQLTEKIHTVEHELYPRVIERILEEK